MAANTPTITARAQPAVMTIHPDDSAFERLSSTPATTPLPSRIRISVPMNSPKKGVVICLPLKVLCALQKTLCTHEPAAHPTQLKDRVTAFFQSEYSRLRVAASIPGSQVRSTPHFSRNSPRLW